MKRNWVLYLLALGVFVMATAEIVVSGILGMIAQDMNISIGMAGQLVTVYALVIAIGSPILMALTSRFERKNLLLLSYTVFIAANLIGYFSPNFAVLVAARVVQAACASVFTIVALTVGSSLAEPGRQGSAIGTIMMGGGTALAVGVPLGTLIGEYWGWRFVFLFILILAAIPTIGLAAAVPRQENKESVSITSQLSVLRDRRLISGFLITFFMVTGYQLMFTYIAPFLQQTAGLSTAQISAALFTCGIFAVIGSRTGGYGSDRWGIYLTLLASLLLHAAALTVLPLMATTFAGALIILALWIGSATMTIPVQQYYLISLAPESSGLSLGMNNSIFQLGMAVGAGAGGWAVNQTSVLNLGWFGAVIVLLGLIAAFYSFSLNKQPAMKVE
ncbi:MFS transporter [Paenibacillus sp. P25]|nr:MFS transporter [Paenibacillus sp. P25]